MSRPLRLHVPGMLYHAVARGNDKQCIFIDDTDYASFLELLERTLTRFAIRCLAYCLLWNHYHLMLLPAEMPISRMMQQLNSVYCQRFNRRHGRVGHVLQGRFASRIIDTGAYARSALRYVALNPVMAGRAQRPEDWQWSSYARTMAIGNGAGFLDLERIWAAFGTSNPSVGRDRFVTFVRAGIEDVFLNPLLHGSNTLVKMLSPELEPLQDEIEFLYLHRFACRPAITDLFAGHSAPLALRDAAYRAFSHHGYTLGEIGAVVHRTPSAIWRWVQHEAQRRRGASAEEDKNGKFKI